MLSVFSVFDVKVGSYSPPFFMAHKGLAIRAFTDLVNDGSSSISKYSSDFILFEIGSFDEHSGCVKMHESFINLGVALDYKNKSKI
nr:MAG: nonstructural protein [Microvirus sp.]